MSDFISENWVAIISLIVAVFGGAPGIISIVNYFRDKSKLHFYIQHTITGSMSDSVTKTKRVFILFSGILSNKGSNPVLPAHFHLKLKEFKNVEFSRAPIIQSEYLGPIHVIHIQNPQQRDFNVLPLSVDRYHPLHGHFMFSSDKVPLEELTKDSKKRKYELRYADVSGKMKTCKIVDRSFSIDDQPVSFPKLGISIVPLKTHI
ncbi:MAG: hypothetical protein LC664_10605 [Flavobacteriales bacterium]|nr:hypothetical protein [Flavobacteriales bacterium]